MDDWAKIKVAVKHKDGPGTVHSRMTEPESARYVVQRMQGHFRSPEEARDAQETQDQRWSAFVADIRDMEKRHASIGIEHARVVSVDFSAVREMTWGRDEEWER